VYFTILLFIISWTANMIKEHGSVCCVFISLYKGQISRYPIIEGNLISEFACVAHGPKKAQSTLFPFEWRPMRCVRRADKGFFEFQCRMQISLQSILQRCPSAVLHARTIKLQNYIAWRTSATLWKGGVQCVSPLRCAIMCASTKTQLRKRSRCASGWADLWA
jgi:hypothetical protein